MTALSKPPHPAYTTAAGAARGVRVPAHERVVLPNGLTLTIVPRRDVPLIAFSAVIRGGARADPDARPGVASVLAGLLEKGAGERDAYAFADAVEGAGGSFNAGASRESISINGQFLARDQALLVELLADALRAPRCSPVELEKLCRRQRQLIKAAKDSDPSELLGTYGRAFLFGEHPYGKPVIGSERSLAEIGSDDVWAYYRREFGSERLLLTFAGDLDMTLLERAIVAAFGDAARSPVPARPLAAAPRQRGRRVLLVDSPSSEQTYFWIGNVGVSKYYRPRAALDLVNTLFGGRFTSMLNTELRIRTGLSYGARSSFTRSSQPGELAIRSFTQTVNTSLALDLALGSVGRLKREGITLEMLDSARAYLLGQYPLGFETAADWALAMSELEFYGLNEDYIESYAAELQRASWDDAHRVIEEAFPDPDDLTIVLIGDAAQIRATARNYGTMIEMPITHPEFTPPGF